MLLSHMTFIAVKCKTVFLYITQFWPSSCNVRINLDDYIILLSYFLVESNFFCFIACFKSKKSTYRYSHVQRQAENEK